MTPAESRYPIYTFSSFSETMARKAFGLHLQLQPEGFLDVWQDKAATMIITVDEQARLKRLQQKIVFFVRAWNEQELREKFIIPLCELVDFDMLDIEVASFAERDLKIVHKQSLIRGKVEWMVASGLFEPEKPFFFIHEYKKEKESSNDPLGQLLATLAVVQELNKQMPKPNLFNPNPSKEMAVPLYGCYVLGRFWFFVRLKEQQYYVSRSYDSTSQAGLQDIFKLLKAQKAMIRELVTK